MSISDLNNDKTNDLVVVDATGTTLTAYYYDDTASVFGNSASFSLPAGWFVDGVFPTNIPQALQNLIVMASRNDAAGALESKLFYFKQSEVSGAASLYAWKETSSDLNNIALYPGSQPMLLDVNGDQA